MMLFLNQSDLQQCLDRSELINCMERALQHFSNGECTQIPRSVIEIDPIQKKLLGFMPSYTPKDSILGYKTITVFHNNVHHDLNAHQGIVVLLEPNTGVVKSIMDGSFITAVRTAAVSAAATRTLSRKESQTLALIGAGVQAFEHVTFIAEIRPIRQIRVYSRTQQTYHHLCQKIKSANLDIQSVSWHATPQAAISAADIVVTCTPSKKSLLSLLEFSEGTHINAVGACTPEEIEISFFNRPFLKIYLDSLPACFAESEEIVSALQQKNLDQTHILGEIGALFAHKIPGRTSKKEITVFKSVGLAIEDLYAADYFYQKAMQLQIGQQLQ